MSTKKLLTLLLCFWAATSTAQTITTFAGNGLCNYSGDNGQATAAGVGGPGSITRDQAGNIYVSQQENYVIRKISPDGVISRYAGTGTGGYSSDGGPASAADLLATVGIYADKAGNLYISDGGTKIRKVDPAGTISTFAGTWSSTFGGDGGPATAAGIGVSAIYADTAGNILIAGGQRLRKVDAAGIITTIAGTGVLGFSGDGGPATNAQFGYVNQMFVDRNNNIYLCDEYNNRIRKIDGNGIITTVAGGGTYTGNGIAATSAKLRMPQGVSMDSCGNLYISESSGSAIRVVDHTGIIYTLAGTGELGFGGDGGSAGLAKLNSPHDLYIAPGNELYFSDHMNCRIRKIALPRCDSMVFPSAVAEVATSEKDLAIWPNPANNQLQLQLNTPGAPAEVSIVSLTGSTLQKLLLPAGKPITIPLHVPAGMYIVIAETSQGRIAKKLVVQ